MVFGTLLAAGYGVYKSRAFIQRHAPPTEVIRDIAGIAALSGHPLPAGIYGVTQALGYLRKFARYDRRISKFLRKFSSRRPSSGYNLYTDPNIMPYGRSATRRSFKRSYTPRSRPYSKSYSRGSKTTYRRTPYRRGTRRTSYRRTYKRRY